MNLKILIGVVVISLFVLSAVTYLGDLKGKYDVTANLTGFNNTQNRLETINARYEQTFSDQESSSFPGSDFIDAIKFGVNQIRSVWSSVTIFVFDLPRDVNDILTDQKLIPVGMNWLLPAIFSIIMAAFVIFLIGAYLRYKVG